MRQAPQEIIEPNELPEEEGGDENVDDDQSEQEEEEEQQQDEVMINTSSAKKSKQSGGVVRCDFNEIKLCSKNGAFLISKDQGAHFLYFSTQNSRVKGEVEKQKMQI